MYVLVFICLHCYRPVELQGKIPDYHVRIYRVPFLYNVHNLKYIKTNKQNELCGTLYKHRRTFPEYTRSFIKAIIQNNPTACYIYVFT